MNESSSSAELMAEITRLRNEIDSLQQRVEQLDMLAHNDSLVPLPNRRGFLRELKQRIDRADRYGDSSAVLFLDVDGLKQLNDSFGHHAGDAALIHLAEILSGGVRQSDCVARLGGDEFAILLERTDADQAQETARRLSDLVAESGFIFEGKAIPLSAPIGVALIEPGDCAEAVLDRADRAMYAVKDAA